MSSVALRQLKLGSLKQIYRMDTFELTAAVQSAGKRRITERPLWDALLYRAALLGPELRPQELALTLDAVARARHRDASFEDFLLKRVRAKASRFLVHDGALLLNALAKLTVRDELLTRSLMPPLIRRIGKQTQLDDLALLALALTRLGDTCREAISDQIVASVTPRIGKVSHGQTLSMMACAFTVSAKSGAPGSTDALFADDEVSEFFGNYSEQPNIRDNGEDQHAVQHLSFVEVLLEQCERHMWNFRGSDLLHLALALSALARSGNDHLFPSRLLRRLQKRMEDLFFEFLPVQLVRFLEVVAHLPELQHQCAAKLLDEVAYQIRELTPASCLSVLRTIRRVGGHPKAHSAVSWRLTWEDAPKMLSVMQVCEIAELLRDLRPWLWESREALLILLQGLHRRQQEPQPPAAARLLSAYGELSVRDTHWFRLCKKLYVRDLTTLKPLTQLSELEPLDEGAVAHAVLALAWLNLPRLVDAAGLFTRAAAVVKSPEHVARVLEAAAIFCLIERRPTQLFDSSQGDLLAPLIAAWTTCRAERAEKDGKPYLRLFPFADTVNTMCAPDILEEMRATAASYATPHESDEFQLSVGRELSSWPEIGLVSNVVVGPLCVPWAASLVGLAEHLKKSPLEQSGASSAHAEPEVEDLPGASTAFSLGPSEGPLEAEGPAGPEEPSSTRVSGRRSRRRRSSPRTSESPALGPSTALEEEASEAFETDGDEPRPQTHILVDLLRDSDFYHASTGVRSERQRLKKYLLSARRFAEISLLRHFGWRVCCIPEHLWSIGPDGDTEAAHSNKELIFKIVAGLSREK